MGNNYGMFMVTVDGVERAHIKCSLVKPRQDLNTSKMHYCTYSYRYPLELNQAWSKELTYNRLIYELTEKLHADVPSTSTIGDMYGELPCESRNIVAFCVSKSAILARDFVYDGSMTDRERGEKADHIEIDMDEVDKLVSDGRDVGGILHKALVDNYTLQ